VLQHGWAEQIWDRKERLAQALPSDSSGTSVVASFFTTTFGALGNSVVVLFLGLFLAISPDWYANGLIRLFPVHRRERAREVLEATGNALGSWLIAKLTTMTVIGVLTTLGLWLLGIDLALVLGVIAALLSFIPNIGPIASVIPAALIALVTGPEKALYVLLLYAAVQTAESYLLTPMLQQHMVDLPPALLLTMQVLLGVLAVILGVILAVPLTAAGMIMVKMWYVEDMLGDR
jgi:predicted PurR-regulated permease PerM